jgi:hypothetical protein
MKGQLGLLLIGNPAVSLKPVAFRSCLTTGLALANYLIMAQKTSCNT